MKNLEKLNIKQLTRKELKSIKGGDACSDRAHQCISGLPCVVGSYPAFVACIDTAPIIIGCSPLFEFEQVCPNAGL